MRLVPTLVASIAAASLLACDGPPPGADRAVEAGVAAFERRWAAAAVARDSAALERLVAPEWTITLADGRRSDRPRALARWTAPPAPGVLRDTSIVDSVEVRRLGPDAAVVTAAIADVEVRAAGAETTRTRVTDVVVRRGGRWQAVVSHESVRPAPPPPRP